MTKLLRLDVDPVSETANWASSNNRPNGEIKIIPSEAHARTEI